MYRSDVDRHWEHTDPCAAVCHVPRATDPCVYIDSYYRIVGNAGGEQGSSARGCSCKWVPGRTVAAMVPVCTSLAKPLHEWSLGKMLHFLAL